MKTKVNRYEVVEREVDVEFPLYHVYHSDDDHEHYRIDEDGTVTCVTFSEASKQVYYFFEVRKIGLNEALSDYARSTPSTAGAYLDAIKKAREAFDTVFPIDDGEVVTDG